MRNRRKLIVIIILILITTLVGLYLYTRQSSEPIITLPGQRRPVTTFAPKNIGGLKPNEVLPGDSLDKVKSILGDPLEIDGDKYFFESNSQYRLNEAIFSNSKLIFFKEIITSQDERTLTDFQNTFGNPPYILYGEGTSSGNYLFVYPGQGIAFIGNYTDNSILEIWYFKPMTIEDFKSQWAPDYLDSIQEWQHSETNAVPF